MLPFLSNEQIIHSNDENEYEYRMCGILCVLNN